MVKKKVMKSIVAAAAILANSCASLVAPDVKSEPAALKTGQYILDQDHASIIFKIDHLGYSTYVGRINRFDAGLDFDASNPAASSVEALVDMTSLDVANDAFEETLKGPAWFDAPTFPQAAFRTRAIQITGPNSGVADGELTLHGVTAAVTLDVEFNGGAYDLLRGAYVIGFSANGRISRRRFGVDRFDGVVGDDVQIEIEAEFIRRGG